VKRRKIAAGAAARTAAVPARRRCARSPALDTRPTFRTETTMEFFLDTAVLDEIRQGVEWGMVDGVTTNPSLIASQGKPYLPTVREIARLCPGPVSGEVLATEREEILEQGRRLAELADNVVVKVPLTPDGLSAVRTLKEEGIPTNVTLCFSANQALLAAKAGAAYISPFVGRVDDIGLPGMELVEQILTIYEAYGFDTKVLVASIRHPEHVLRAALLGADVGTMPFKVLQQLYKHPLTDVGLDRFLADWKKTGRSFAD
jgi:transaldolase